ncbi:type II secretion system protein [Herbaspirillum sp. HC18]|nr:type II secretion system protein [Herbaspirillum sp. HC18]
MCTSAAGRTRQSGISLIELVMFIVIISVALAGILSVLNVTSRHSADPQQRKQALAIAEALLEEVRSAQFTYCDPADEKAEDADNTSDCTTSLETVGPEAGNTRPFDNVNDYVSKLDLEQPAFNNSGGVLADVAGTALPVTGYTATLRLTSEELGGISSGATPAAMEVLRITVRVSYGSESITLDGYRTRYAPRFVQ